MRFEHLNRTAVAVPDGLQPYAASTPHSGIELVVLLRVGRIGFLDGGEVQKHGGDRRLRIDLVDRCPDPKAFGSSAAAERDHFARELVILTGEERSSEEPD